MGCIPFLVYMFGIYSNNPLSLILHEICLEYHPIKVPPKDKEWIVWLRM
jgi:hypothetical protein